MIPFGRDEGLAQGVMAAGRSRVEVWTPDRWQVVLGRSNRPEREVHLDRCRADGVPVVRRRGGGGAVVLGPGCLVIGVAVPAADPLGVGSWMASLVTTLAEGLGGTTGLPLVVRGTGDLCVGDRKVLGSSAFARRGCYGYQGSLLVTGDLGRIDRYLRHPTREPVYRGGRPHRSFLTTLKGAGATMGTAELAEALERWLAGRLGVGDSDREPGSRGGVPERPKVIVRVG